MMCRSLLVICLIGLNCFLLPAATSAQMMTFEPDLNVPSYTNPENSIEPGFSYTVGLFSKSYLGTDAKKRWGIMLGQQKLIATRKFVVAEPNEYSAISLQYGRDWLVFERSRLAVAVGMAAGAALITQRHNECTGLFCGSPDGVWLVTPYTKFSIPVWSSLSLAAGVRGTILVGDHHDMFPYESGVVFSLGIGLSAKPGQGADKSSGAPAREAG